jgi:hypothetical protein
MGNRMPDFETMSSFSSFKRQRTTEAPKFKEFNLKTSQLKSTLKFLEKTEEIKKEKLSQYEYRPFKAQEVNKKMLAPRLGLETGRLSVAPVVGGNQKHLVTASEIKGRATVEPARKPNSFGLGFDDKE